MIRKIKLVNFMTYSHVELFAGPRHNLVLGPNGSGKSSLLCAIGLGLGGKPKILGRADDLGLFILYEQKKAQIEITLQDHAADEVVVIRREFIDTSKKASNYYMRKAPVADVYRKDAPEPRWTKVTEEQVNSKVLGLGVDVNNLTVFMPQERVGEFSGIEPKSLLLNTIDVVANVAMKEQQKLLASLEDDISTMSKEEGSRTRNMQQLEREVERLQGEKERMDQRVQLMEEAENYEKALLWANFEALRLEGRKVQEEYKKIEGELQEKEVTLEPLAREAEQLDTQVAKARTQSKSLAQRGKKLKKEYDEASKEVKDCDAQFAIKKQELLSMNEFRLKKQRRVDEHKAKVSQFLKEKGSIDVDSLDEQIHETKGRLEKADRARLDASERLHQLDSVVQDLNAEEGRKKARLRNLENRVFKVVNRMSKSGGRPGAMAAKAFELVQDMRSQRMFRGNVYGPVLAEISVENAFHARCVEHFIPLPRKCTFVAEHQEDYQLLVNRLKDRRISVAVAHANRGTLNRSISDELMGDMRAKGIADRLEDVMDAPAAVKTFLNHFVGTDRVMLAAEDLTSTIDASVAGWLRGCKSFNIYYPRKDDVVRFDVRESSYSGKATTTSQSVANPRFLGSSASEDVDSLQAELAQLQERLQATSAEKEAMHDDARRTESERKLLKKQMETLRAARQKPQVLDKQIKASRRKIEQLEAELAEDAESAREAILQDIRQLCVESKGAIERMQGATREHLDSMLLHTHNSMRLKVVEARHEAVAARYEDARSGHSQLQTALQDTKKYLKDLKKRARAAKSEADRVAPLNEVVVGEDGQPVAGEDGQHVLQDTPFSKFWLDVVNEVGVDAAAIQDLHTEKLAEANRIVENDDIFRQYKAAVSELEKHKSKCDKAGGELQAKKEEFDELRKRQVLYLQGVSENISHFFEEYMQELGFDGCVRIDTEGPSVDWSLLIQVQFRRAVPMQTLSAQVHSGGERAVSTIMFLMALNTIVQSPLRIVDEINQGMDERNERLVMRRIIANTTGTGGKQYFLITPKLLEGLSTMEQEDVTIHVVYNGRRNVCSKDWDLSEFCERKRQRIA